MSKADDIFIKEFAAVIGTLVVFAIVMYFLAYSIHDRETARIGNLSSAIETRIAPVAQVRVGEPGKVAAAEKAPEPAAASGGGEMSAEQVYQSVCMACHATGAAGAPKYGDKAAWEPRIANGADALYASVINGKGAMPPKGGNPSLSDDAVRATVDYMLAAVGVGGGEAKSETAEPKAAESKPAEAAPAESAPAQSAQAQSAPAQSAPAQSAPAESAPAETAAASGGDAGLPAEADGKPGNETYQTACMACHLSGVANAPKLGDKAAWEPRLANGASALLQSVINGKGAMPPRAGQPSLSDADLANAIRYMLGEAGLSVN